MPLTALFGNMPLTALFGNGTVDLRFALVADNQKSVANLRDAIATFERVRVYYSTARWTPPRLVAVARAGRVARQGATPAWLETALTDRDA